MDFLNRFKWTPVNIIKAFVLFVLGILLISVIFKLLNPVVAPVFNSARDSVSQSAPSFGVGGGTGFYGGNDYVEEAVYDGAYGEVKLSLNNIGIPYPIPGETIGGDAEDFEVTEYSAYIETRNKERTCEEVADLKSLDYVVFENSNDYERGCNHIFKVEHDKVSEILAIIESFDPRELSENTYTIKRQLDDFTSETEILERKLSSINETLNTSIRAYDEITNLAVRTQNADALAQIISSKIGIIERLTQERINITAQLERLERAKLEQLDKLDYTYFYINVYENKFVDGDSIKDSWKQSIRNFVRDANNIIQGITINLILILLVIVQYVLYLLILVVVLKYLWKFTKYVWKK